MSVCNLKICELPLAPALLLGLAVILLLLSIWWTIND